MTVRPPTEVPGEVPATEVVEDRTATRATVVAHRVGAAAGLAVFLAVLTGLSPTLLSWTPTGGFYDAQAESLLEGRLDVDPERLGIEGFAHEGRTYLYQPPWPAVLRLPVVAATDRFEGRLGALSMLLAHLLLVVAAERILVEARRSVRPSARVGRLERAGTAAFGLVVAGGSVPTFLASRSWVYHEAALWGAAWSLVGVAGVLALRRRASLGAVVATAGGCAGAVASRASVGAGTGAALGVLAVIVFLERRPRRLRERLGGWGGPVLLLAAAALPALGYAALNTAKFGNPTSIPFEDQAFTAVSPARQAMLEENDGSLFGLRFAPTTALHYLRPAGIRVSEQFPFVDFPPAGGPVVGDVTFDLVDHTASIPATLPALVAPAAVGAWLLLRRPVTRRSTWVAVGVGGVVGSLTIVAFGYVAHRYLADVVPLVVPLGALGWQHVLTVRGRARRRVVGASLALLVPWTVWANVGLATVYQRVRAPNPAPELVAGLVEARMAIGAEPDVVRADALPPRADRDDLAVVGDCAALYVWDGSPVGEFRRDAWTPVERTRRAGHVRVRVQLGELHEGRRYPLAATRGGESVTAWLGRVGDEVVAGVDVPTGGVTSSAVDVGDRPWFDVVIDRYLGEAVVRVDGRKLVSTAIGRGRAPEVVLGRPTGTDGYEPSTPIVEESSDDGALCRRVAALPGG